MVYREFLYVLKKENKKYIVFILFVIHKLIHKHICYFPAKFRIYKSLLSLSQFFLRLTTACLNFEVSVYFLNIYSGVLLEL